MKARPPPDLVPEFAAGFVGAAEGRLASVGWIPEPLCEHAVEAAEATVLADGSTVMAQESDGG